MPVCHRCQAVLASAELRRVRRDSTRVEPGAYVCKDRTACTLREIARERVEARRCRHCGGSVPCWSPYGDREVGLRHTAKSLREMKR